MFLQQRSLIKSPSMTHSNGKWLQPSIFYQYALYSWHFVHTLDRSNALLHCASEAKHMAHTHIEIRECHIIKVKRIIRSSPIHRKIPGQMHYTKEREREKPKKKKKNATENYRIIIVFVYSNSCKELYVATRPNEMCSHTKLPITHTITHNRALC